MASSSVARLAMPSVCRRFIRDANRNPQKRRRESVCSHWRYDYTSRVARRYVTTRKDVYVMSYSIASKYACSAGAMRTRDSKALNDDDTINLHLNGRREASSPCKSSHVLGGGCSIYINEYQYDLLAASVEISADIRTMPRPRHPSFYAANHHSHATANWALILFHLWGWDILISIKTTYKHIRIAYEYAYVWFDMRQKVAQINDNSATMTHISTH